MPQLRSLVSILTLLLGGCGSSGSADTLTSGDGSSSLYTGVRFAPFVSAHRGGAAYAPENTLNAYRNAARLGVDDFEADTTLSADGVLVLIHDDTLDRTTDCSGPVNVKTYEELQACDAAFWFSPGQGTTSPDEALPHPLRGVGVVIPKAEELFAYARSLGEFGPTVTIEIKNIPGESGFELNCSTAATALVQLIHNSGIKERIIVQSFDPTCIDTVKRLDNSIQTLFLTVAGAYANLAYTVAGGHDFSSPPFDTPDFNLGYVDAAHAAGKQVSPYTADREADIQSLIALGVDGIITNFPACMLRLQGRVLPASVIAPEAGPGPGTELCAG
jgi:glycerophosphoryl diester phosphodiesterase